MTYQNKATGNDPLSSLPVFGLLVLTTALFISILTEALPAGFLLSIQSAFGVSASSAGQWITVYALGSLVSAVPLTLMTQHWSRKKLLLLTLAGFALSNSVTAFTDIFSIALVARFLAGVFAGLLWSLAAGYASRMVPENMQGRAITLVMLGVPLALSLGVPMGTFLGNIYGWRTVFYGISTLSVLLFLTGYLLLPEQAGTRRSERFSIQKATGMPGVKAILCVNFLFALGHNVMYTYVAPYLKLSGNADAVSTFLLILGIMAVVSIVMVGIFIDKHLRELVLLSLSIFMASAVIFSLFSQNLYVILGGAFLWGLGFGGGATLFQTASAKTAGSAADIAQSLMVTVWNVAIAGGGFLGGELLDRSGALSLPITLFMILLVSFCIVLASSRHGFKR